MRIGARSDVGKVRRVNQDVGFFDEVLGLFVADGMGGHNGGEIASQTAVDALVITIDLVHSLPTLNVRLPWLTRPSGRRSKAAAKGMGTTVTLAKVVDQRVLIVTSSLGPIWLVIGRGKQLTNDHQ